MSHNEFCQNTNSINCTCDREEYIAKLESENSALRSELTKLNAKWAGAEAEVLREKHKAERMKEALEKITKGWDKPTDAYGKPIGCQECGGTEIAREALKLEEGTERT